MPGVLELFLTFMKIGVMTFGGGYAMIPLLMREIVTKNEWLTQEEFTDYVAISQATPGVVAVNVATFVGSRKRGVLGGITATLGVIFPSVCIITVIAALLREYSSISYVQHAFAGIRVCVCALIFKTVFALWKSAVTELVYIFVFAIVLLSSLFLSITPVLAVIGAAIFGVVYKRLRRTGE